MPLACARRLKNDENAAYKINRRPKNLLTARRPLVSFRGDLLKLRGGRNSEVVVPKYSQLNSHIISSCQVFNEKRERNALHLRVIYMLTLICIPRPEAYTLDLCFIKARGMQSSIASLLSIAESSSDAKLILLTYLSQARRTYL